MAKRFRELRYLRWAGTVAELKAAAEHSEEVLDGWVGKPTRVEASYTTRDGRDGADTLAILDSITPHELRDIEVLSIAVGEYRGPRVQITASKRRGLLVEIQGDDRTRVEGLRSELEQRLRHGKQFWAILDPLWLAMLVAVLWLLGFIFLSTALDPDPPAVRTANQSNAHDAIVVVAVVGAALSFIVARRLMPDLELLREGQRPVVVRWWRWVAGFALAVSSSVLATLLLKPFE